MMVSIMIFIIILNSMAINDEHVQNGMSFSRFGLVAATRGCQEIHFCFCVDSPAPGVESMTSNLVPHVDLCMPP